MQELDVAQAQVADAEAHLVQQRRRHAAVGAHLARQQQRLQALDLTPQKKRKQQNKQVEQGQTRLKPQSTLTMRRTGGSFFINRISWSLSWGFGFFFWS